MTGDSNKRADEAVNAVESSSDESVLEDLKPTADVNGGYVPKATDVTLKRGVID